MTKISNSTPKDKVLSFYNICKIEVMDFMELKTGRIVCSCFTPNVPHDLEPSHLVISVNVAELVRYIYSRPEIVKDESFVFGSWYSEQTDDSIKTLLQDCINKREKRILVWNADLQDLFINVQRNIQLTEANNNDISLLRSLIFNK